jgi:hypothetical protein
VKLDGATFDFERAHMKLQRAIKSTKNHYLPGIQKVIERLV